MLRNIKKGIQDKLNRYMPPILIIWIGCMLICKNTYFIKVTIAV